MSRYTDLQRMHVLEMFVHFHSIKHSSKFNFSSSVECFVTVQTKEQPYFIALSFDIHTFLRLFAI